MDDSAFAQATGIAGRMNGYFSTFMYCEQCAFLRIVLIGKILQRIYIEALMTVGVRRNTPDFTKQSVIAHSSSCRLGLKVFTTYP